MLSLHAVQREKVNDHVTALNLAWYVEDVLNFQSFPEEDIY